MTTPSEILDEAGDETEACPECKGVGRIDSGLRIEQPASLPPELAFQLAMGELVEWSAGKVQTTLVMTLLVALAGAVGAGVGSTMEDDALRACFDHGFNSKPRERE